MVGRDASRSASTSPLAPRPSPLPHRGFTLVELLVAVALTVMIMSLFAEVFQSATSMISIQKGLAENDARERTIQTMMLNDFKKRTYQELIPFQGLLSHDTRLLDSLDAREGYFSISENDPDNNLDDVIAFTIRSTTGVAGLDSETRLYGRATSLQNSTLTGVIAGGFTVADPMVSLGFLPAAVQSGDKICIQGVSPANVNGVYTVANYNAAGDTISVVETVPPGPYTLTSNSKLYLSRSLGNEPEFDDGQFLINNAGMSSTAEVAYYVRNGNLYRRQLLIREPHEPQPDPSLPESETGSLLITGNYIVTGNSFWNDFDYSAHRIVGEDANENGILDSGEDADMDGNISGAGMRFHIDTDLSNAGSGVIYSLGMPAYRFGHAPSLFYGHYPAIGAGPREFAQTGEFLGRFTQQDTSQANFGYPGNIVPGQNPMNWDLPVNATTSTVVNPNTGAVFEYEGLNRRGEDIIATNVHEFDIKVFAADFGADGAPGVAGVDDDADGFADWLNPPFNTIPDLEEVGVAGSDDIVGFYDLGRGGTGLYTAANGYLVGLDGQPGVAGTDDDGNGVVDDVSELGWAGSDDVSYGNRFDTWHVNAPGMTPYRHISNGADKQPGLANWDDDQDGYVDNYWSVGPDGQPGVAGVDDDGNMVIDDESELGWAGSDDVFSRELGFIGTDDEVPLRAIQIRIRFMDAASNQMRQMTMVISLDDLE